MTKQPSYGQFTPEQIKEAMNKPFGRTMPYLESMASGVCKSCGKPQKDLPKHLANDNTPQSRNLLVALEAVLNMIGGKRGPVVIK